MKLSLFSLLAGALTFGTTSVQATSGHATWFEQHGNPGSCGVVHSDYDYIVAVSMVAPFNYNNGFNEHCGRTVTITNVGGGDNNNGVGNTITALVADTCPDLPICDPTHLDLSIGAFTALSGGNLSPPGKIDIEWSFN